MEEGDGEAVAVPALREAGAGIRAHAGSHEQTVARDRPPPRTRPATRPSAGGEPPDPVPDPPPLAPARCGRARRRAAVVDRSRHRFCGGLGAHPLRRRDAAPRLRRRCPGRLCSESGAVAVLPLPRPARQPVQLTLRRGCRGLHGEQRPALGASRRTGAGLRLQPHGAGLVHDRTGHPGRGTPSRRSSHPRPDRRGDRQPRIPRRGPSRRTRRRHAGGLGASGHRPGCDGSRRSVPRARTPDLCPADRATSPRPAGHGTDGGDGGRRGGPGVDARLAPHDSGPAVDRRSLDPSVPVPCGSDSWPSTSACPSRRRCSPTGPLPSLPHCL